MLDNWRISIARSVRKLLDFLTWRPYLLQACAIAMVTAGQFMTAAAEPPAQDAVSLIRKCIDAETVLNHVSMNGIVDVVNTPALNDGMQGQHDEFLWRRDGKRLDVSGLLRYSNQDKPIRYRTVVNGDALVAYNFAQNRQAQRPSSGLVGTRRETIRDQLDGVFQHGGALDGYHASAGGKRLSALLAEAADLHIRGDESIGTVQCTVIEGSTEYGNIAIWIAPSQGFNMLKYVFEKGPGHLFWQGKSIGDVKMQYTVSGVKQTLTSISTVLDSVELVEKPEGYVPVSGKCTITNHLTGGIDVLSTVTIVRSNVDLHPKFESTDAFKSDLPEGVAVMNLDDDKSGISYLWRAGKAVRGFGYYKPDPADFATDDSTRRSKWATYTWVAVGAVALLTGIWLLWRAKARRTA